MPSVVFPIHAEDLTPELLTAALAERHPDARVESLRVVDQAHCKSGSASTAARAVLDLDYAAGADSGDFSINSTTGVLTFSLAKDFETPTDANTDGVYEVQVTVDDGNGGTDVQTINVTVTDVNDAPVITSDGGGATANVNVAEGTTAVTTVTATDQDDVTV